MCKWLAHIHTSVHIRAWNLYKHVYVCVSVFVGVYLSSFICILNAFICCCYCHCFSRLYICSRACDAISSVCVCVFFLFSFVLKITEYEYILMDIERKVLKCSWCCVMYHPYLHPPHFKDKINVCMFHLSAENKTQHQ